MGTKYFKTVNYLYKGEKRCEQSEFVNLNAARQSALNTLSTLDWEGRVGGGNVCTSITVSVFDSHPEQEHIIYTKEEE